MKIHCYSSGQKTKVKPGETPLIAACRLVSRYENVAMSRFDASPSSADENLYVGDLSKLRDGDEFSVYVIFAESLKIRDLSYSFICF